jgi:hypothetical protein
MGIELHAPARIAAAVLLLLGALTCDSRETPSELVGVWRTDLPSHRDRSLEIRDHWVVFGAGRYASSVHSLTGVQAEPSKDGVRYTLHYTGAEGDEQILRLEYTPGSPDSIRLANRKERWVRERDASWLQKGAP